MKKIKNKWQVWVNALLTTIMGWLAMSCDLAPMYGPPVNLYAPPAPDPESYLVVEGKVVDEVGRPLANIRVDLKTPLLGEYVPEIYTDEQGLFAYSENCTPDLERDTLQLHFSDVYQVYASDSLKVPFVKMEIDTLEADIYGYKCNVSMQLAKKEQSTE
jgi:putative lipoprotein (rSAM/lipoprotein system)